MDAVVIGGVRVDHIIAADGTWAGPVLGGNALYAAAAVNLWGRSVGVVSRINGQVATNALGGLAAADIDTGGISTIAGHEGLNSFMRYRHDGEREGMTAHEFSQHTGADLLRDGDTDVSRHDVRYEQLHVAVSPTPEEIPRDYRTAALFLLMTMPWSCHRAFVSYLTASAGSILLDPYPTYMASATDAALKDLLQGIRVLLPSEVELTSRFSNLDVQEGASRLLALGCEAVVVKLGPRGSLLLRRDQSAVAVPAYQTVAKDPTGAGDAFMGGFAAGLLETGDLLEAVLYGTVAASFAVEDFGLLHLLSIDRRVAGNRLEKLRHVLYSSTS